MTLGLPAARSSVENTREVFSETVLDPLRERSLIGGLVPYGANCRVCALRYEAASPIRFHCR